MNRRSFLFSAAAGLSLPGLSTALQTASSPYRRPSLKITDVRTAQVQAHGHQVHVRIYTDQGLIGQGEATDAAVGAPAIIRSPSGAPARARIRSTSTPSASASAPRASSRARRAGST